jgi:hypothetical protein
MMGVDPATPEERRRTGGVGLWGITAAIGISR